MKTISIDVDATSVQIETSMAGNGYVRVTAEVDERDSTKLLDSISKDIFQIICVRMVISVKLNNLNLIKND